jgi:hypothetical protein
MSETDTIDEDIERPRHDEGRDRQAASRPAVGATTREGVWVEWVRPTELGTRMAGMLARNGVDLDRRLRTALMQGRIEATDRLRQRLADRRARLNGARDPERTEGMATQRSGFGR